MITIKVLVIIIVINVMTEIVLLIQAFLKLDLYNFE